MPRQTPSDPFDSTLSNLRVGSKVWFVEECQGYTVQARSDRFLVCSKPFNALKTVLYCIIDVEEQRRGQENLIFGAGAETREQCEKMLERLEGRDPDTGFTTRISHRGDLPLHVRKVKI